MDVVIRRSMVEGEATPPASKSYTHRLLIAASLSPLARIYNPLISEDTLATLNACKAIGASIRRFKDYFVVKGSSIDASGYIYAANSGTTLRFLLGILSLSTNPRYIVLDGDASLRKRPNSQLVNILKMLGADIKGKEDFKAPLWVRGIIKGGKVDIEAESSQFISSLLFALPLAKGDSTIKVISTKSRPYIDITLHVLEESGIEVQREEPCTFYIPGEQRYNLRKFAVPSDFSSASYLIAAGLLAGDVKITNMFESKQGDQRIVEIVKEMNGEVKWNRERGEIRARKSELRGIDVDAANVPDLVPTIAVLAALADGKTRIYNAEHLRIKEIDRIEGIYKNLTALGVEVRKRKDGLEIFGKNSIEGGIVDSLGDHRMALAFALLGLVADRVVVKNAEVVSISFPNYFDTLSSLGANVSIR